MKLFVIKTVLAKRPKLFFFYHKNIFINPFSNLAESIISYTQKKLEDLFINNRKNDLDIFN